MKTAVTKLSLCLASVLLLTAWGGGTTAQVSPSPAPTDTPEPSPTAAPWEPVWGGQEYSHTFTDPKTGAEVLTVRYRLPDLTNKPAPDPWAAVSAYYAEEEASMQQGVQSMGAAAQEDFDFCTENGYEFYPYADEQDYELKLDTDQYVSVLRTHYTYLGGAHGEVALLAETFDMTTGEPMTLDQVFTVASDVYTPRVLTELKALAAQQKQEDGTPVFDETTLEDTFDPGCFYLTPDALVIYYQVYTLGSHAMGAPEFSVPREALEDILISW